MTALSEGRVPAMVALMDNSTGNITTIQVETKDFCNFVKTDFDKMVKTDVDNGRRALILTKQFTSFHFPEYLT